MSKVISRVIIASLICINFSAFAFAADASDDRAEFQRCHPSYVLKGTDTLARDREGKIWILHKNDNSKDRDAVPMPENPRNEPNCCLKFIENLLRTQTNNDE